MHDTVLTTKISLGCADISLMPATIQLQNDGTQTLNSKLMSLVNSTHIPEYTVLESLFVQGSL